MKDGKREITLLVSKDIGTKYAIDNLRFGHIYAKVVYMDHDDGVIPKNFSHIDPHKDTQYYEGLTISCQMGSRNDRSYAWQIEYRNPLSVTRNMAQKIYKTLNSLEQRYEKRIRKEGRPESFGQYVTTIAKLIGAKQIMFYKDDTGNSPWYSDYDFSLLSLAESQDKINSMTQEIINELARDNKAA